MPNFLSAAMPSSEAISAIHNVSPAVYTVTRPVPAISAAHTAATSVAAASPAVSLAPQTVRPLPVEGPIPAIRMEHMRFVDPPLALAIADVRRPADGVPRGQITVPICPTENVSDTCLFEDPANPAKKYYLSRYRLAEQNVSGQPHYRIMLEQTSREWVLTVYLERLPAPEVSAAVLQSATELPLQAVTIILRYRVAVGSSGVFKEFAFSERTASDHELRAVLRGNSVAERDQIYQALTRPEYQATLLARRVVKVAVPGPIPLAHEPPTSRMAIASVVRRARKELALGEQVDAGLDSLPLPTSAPPLFRETTRTLDYTLDRDPFVFLPDVHAYIFRNITSVSNQKLSLRRHVIKWREQDKDHAYYQDEATPNLVYYLPDNLKIARRPESPHYPIMKIRFSSPDGSIDNMQATVDYTAHSFIDPDRLKDAAKELTKNSDGKESIEFHLLPPEKLQFKLSLPGQDANMGPFQERPGAQVSLWGITDSVTSLCIDRFRSIFEALMRKSGVIFQGNIRVELGGWPPEDVPFTARMNDLSGRVFDYTLAADQASQGFHVTLRNAIESPTIIKSLKADLCRGTKRVAARIEGFKPPINLPPALTPTGEVVEAGQIKFLLIPAEKIDGTEPIEPLFDLSGVEVIPDPNAIYDALLDPSTLPQPTKDIRVHTSAEVFRPAAKPEETIVAVLVEFERADPDTIRLTSTTLDGKTKVHLPLRDYFLSGLSGKAVSDDYRYRLTIVRNPGLQKSTTGGWKTSSMTELYPEIG